MFELGALFLSAFLAATLLPAQSEVLLGAMYTQGEHAAWILISIATLGNVLGAVLNWFLGRYLLHFQDRKWFPVKEQALNKATAFYQKYGIWTLLFAWLPIVGDPMTLVAGIFRAPFWAFFTLVAIGKALRYAAIILIVSGYSYF
jgi:membrane protein YqaA with SNARE-associated domain